MNDKKLHILQIMVSNTSTMDYSLPIFWKLWKLYPHLNISILYCYKDKRQILRKGKFYSAFYKDMRIREYDFIDFLKPQFVFLKPLLRLYYSRSPLDKGFTKKYQDVVEDNITEGKHSSKLFIVKNKITHIIALFKKKIIVNIFNIENILKILDPALILFDNKFKTTFHGREFFFRYFSEKKTPIILLPHGAYYRTPDSFCSFDEEGEAFPDYCEDWFPFKYQTPWNVYPRNKEQFHYIGYPGLDTDWCKFLMESSHKKSRGTSILKCLFIIREFAIGTRPRNSDPYCMNYNEIFSILKLVEHNLNNLGQAIEVIVKPHPYNNYKFVSRIFTDAGFSTYKISYEPCYALLPHIDFVISFFSTAAIPFIASNIPTIIMNSTLNNIAFAEWIRVKELFSGFRYLLKNNLEFPAVLGRVFEEIKSKKANFAENSSLDLQHLRTFYPDGACNRAIDRIKTYILE